MRFCYRLASHKCLCTYRSLVLSFAFVCVIVRELANHERSDPIAWTHSWKQSLFLRVMLWTLQNGHHGVTYQLVARNCNFTLYPSSCMQTMSSSVWRPRFQALKGEKNLRDKRGLPAEFCRLTGSLIRLILLCYRLGHRCLAMETLSSFSASHRRPR